MKIQDTNNTNIPVIETHYYKWLQQESKQDIHDINTKIEYLKENGFVVGKDFISKEDILTLQAIEQMYFHFEIKPDLESARSAT